MYILNTIALLSFLLQNLILVLPGEYLKIYEPLSYIYYPIVIYYITTNYIQNKDTLDLLKITFKYTCIYTVLTVIFYNFFRKDISYDLLYFFEYSTLISLNLFLAFKHLFCKIKTSNRLLLKCNCFIGLSLLLSITTITRNDFLVILFTMFFILKNNLLKRNIVIFLICLIYPLFTSNINLMFTSLHIVFLNKFIQSKEKFIDNKKYILILSVLIILKNIIMAFN